MQNSLNGRAPRNPMSPVSGNIKFDLVHVFPNLLLTRFILRSSGWCEKAQFDNTLTVFSQRWPQATPLPPADDCDLPEVNVFLSSFGANLAELRDMKLNRLIFYPSRRSLCCVTYRGKGTIKTAFTYLPKPSR